MQDDFFLHTKFYKYLTRFVSLLKGKKKKERIKTRAKIHKVGAT